MKPIIALNFKVFNESFEKIDLLINSAKDVSKETGIRIIICPPTPLLKYSLGYYHDVFSQTCDIELGQFTGTNPLEGLKKIGIKGSLVNHSENKITLNKIYRIVHVAKEIDFETIVCTANNDESKAIACFSPKMIAVEPPELIGTGISVSTAKPEVVINSVDAVKQINNNIIVLCGAGITNSSDVKKAIELGAQGVLLASAYVKAKNPVELLRSYASVI
ncbi:MAG: triose-phosphate isomerase [Candidatus Micrarchaeota archaeon]|nr:triose-phosphate isomerase [Candidatus Micrarchaeota archaeon]